MIENDNEFSREDMQAQLLITVCDITNVMRRINEVKDKIKNQRSVYYFMYGLSRRLLIIENNLRYFHEMLPPTRVKPLDINTSNDAIMHINSLYVNIYGSLDNLAWTLAYELELFPGQINIELTRQKHEVSLFNSKFTQKIQKVNVRNNEKVISLLSYLELSKKWHDDISNFRHPSTHRIPLYVVPSILNKEDVKAYTDHHLKSQASLSTHEYQEAGRQLELAQTYGKFEPYFSHDPDLGLFPIYPTIVNDTIMLLDICRRTISVLLG